MNRPRLVFGSGIAIGALLTACCVALLQPDLASAQQPTPKQNGPRAGIVPVQVDPIFAMQSDIAQLKAEVAKLAKHTHTLQMTNPGGTGNGVLTILNCEGYGKSCTSATGLKEITVMTPGNVNLPPHTYSLTTSGPQ